MIRSRWQGTVNNLRYIGINQNNGIICVHSRIFAPDRLVRKYQFCKRKQKQYRNVTLPNHRHDYIFVFIFQSISKFLSFLCRKVQKEYRKAARFMTGLFLSVFTKYVLPDGNKKSPRQKESTLVQGLKQM